MRVSSPKRLTPMCAPFAVVAERRLENRCRTTPPFPSMRIVSTKTRLSGTGSTNSLPKSRPGTKFAIVHVNFQDIRKLEREQRSAIFRTCRGRGPFRRITLLHGPIDRTGQWRCKIVSPPNTDPSSSGHFNTMRGIALMKLFFSAVNSIPPHNSVFECKATGLDKHKFVRG